MICTIFGLRSILLLSPKIVQIIREEIQKDPGFRF